MGRQCEHAFRPALDGGQSPLCRRLGDNFVAFDAARGVPLWHAGLHASITNGPITYQLDGLQYVVVAANDTLYAFASPPR